MLVFIAVGLNTRDMDTENSFEFDPDNCLRNHFLIAMPALAGSYFSHTVTYICDHNEHGAMGLVINQGMEIDIYDVLDQLGMEHGINLSTPVLSGGPVNEQQGLILHRNEGNQWESTLSVTPDISVTASKDIVAAIAQNRAPSGSQLILGYAGWSPGQLEEELSDNAWLTAPADESILFDTPVEERWAAIAKHIGIDLDLISTSVGHA